jgi:hypothetical protein
MLFRDHMLARARFLFATLLSCTFLGMTVQALAEAPVANAYYDSWELNAANFEYNGNVLYNDPCNSNYGYSTHCEWNESPTQYHNWTLGEVENRGGATVSSLDMGVSKSGSLEWTDFAEGPFPQYSTLSSSEPGSYKPNNVSINYEQEGSSHQLLWGYEGG